MTHVTFSEAKQPSYQNLHEFQVQQVTKRETANNSHMQARKYQSLEIEQQPLAPNQESASSRPMELIKNIITDANTAGIKLKGQIKIHRGLRKNQLLVNSKQNSQPPSNLKPSISDSSKILKNIHQQQTVPKPIKSQQNLNIKNTNQEIIQKPIDKSEKDSPALQQ